MSFERAYRARWIFPTEGDPLAEATLLIERGRIVDITQLNVPEAVDLGNVALIPELVNAHVHLEFGHLEEPIVPFVPFTDWLRNVVAARRAAAGNLEANVKRGIDEVRQTGTRAVGEIATSPASLPMLAPSGLEGVLFHEVIGPLPEMIDPCLRGVRDSLATFAETSSLLQPGLSPHAPYTVHPELLDRLVTVAIEQELPVAMHLAETSCELDLLRSGSGEFRDLLERVELWPGDVWSEFRRVGDYLRLLANAPRCLIVHGNYLNEDDFRFLETRPHMSVAYCPRTHANFGHPPHPWRKLLERGINVCLGTDGRSSNPDLDLWNEVKYLHRMNPDVSGSTLLRMTTTNGALGLGLDESGNGLAIGAPAKLALIENLTPNSSEPYAAILSPETHARTISLTSA
ncbi:MAG TPA: amidohydrolase family protein [Planctomycetaceae bacterium]|nr:amidohydrolase family protein [Planctomycetaceae bacterium]